MFPDVLVSVIAIPSQILGPLCKQVVVLSCEPRLQACNVNLPPQEHTSHVIELHWQYYIVPVSVRCEFEGFQEETTPVRIITITMTSMAAGIMSHRKPGNQEDVGDMRVVDTGSESE